MMRLAKFAAAVLAAAGSSALAQDGGDAAKGRQLFTADGCAYCHGTAAQGGGGRTGGLRIAGMGIPFASFLNQLRHPGNEMPPYVESVLSDKDASDIFAFIASLPKPPDVNSIDILKQ